MPSDDDPRARSAGGDTRRAAARPSRNEVHLVGRVSSVDEQRELPSGDQLVQFRVVVDRPPPRRAPQQGIRLPTVDTILCVAWPARLRRTVSGFAAGDVVELQGSLRQRYWRSGAALASRTEVEVSTARRLARAPT